MINIYLHTLSKTLFKPEVSLKLMWKNAAKVLGLETSEGVKA